MYAPFDFGLDRFDVESIQTAIMVQSGLVDWLIR
jgi:hypothetical protein